MVKLSSGFIKYASASIPATLPEKERRKDVIISNSSTRKAKAPINENNIPKIVPSKVFDIVFGSLLFPNILPKLENESPNATINIALTIISFGMPIKPNIIRLNKTPQKYHFAPLPISFLSALFTSQERNGYLFPLLILFEKKRVAIKRKEKRKIDENIEKR